MAEENKERAECRREEIIEAYKREGSVERVADHFGLPALHVSRIIGTMPTRSLYQRIPRRARVPDEQIDEALRKAAAKTGEPLTIPNYRKVAPTLGLPSDATIVRHRGSWQEACKQAGVKANEPRGSHADLTGRCLAGIRAFIQIHGEVPTYREYAAWAPENGHPSAATVRKYWDGSWTKALKEAIKDGS